MYQVCPGEPFDASLVMHMAPAERGDEDRGVKEFLQSVNSRMRFSRSASIASGIEASEGSPW